VGPPRPVAAHHRASRLFIAALALIMTMATGTSAASAYWSSTGTASAAAATGTLAAPVDLVVPTESTADVAVSWSPGTGGIAPQGYVVTRDDGVTTTSACASSPAALIVSTSCADTDVPDGTYSYAVTAVYQSWTATSGSSSTVTVTSVPTVLGAAASYSVLAATMVVSSGTSHLSGDLGVSPGTSITGFGPGTVGGDIHAGDASAAEAHTAVAAAYADLSTRVADVELVGNLGGLVLTPGVYHQTAAMALTGTLTLDAQGDPDAIFIFQTDAAFNTAAASVLVLTGGAQPSNVYWVPAGAAGTGANSFLSGTIVTEAAITLGASTELIGRALSLDAVTLADATIRFTVALPPSISIDGGATAVTTDVTPTITGTSDAAESSPVTVTVAGQTMATVVSASGTWGVTAAELSAGPHDIVAKVRDAAGNGNVALQSLTVEVNPAPVALGAASTFSVLALTSIVNTDTTTISGDLGVSPATSITGFPPGILAGAIHAGDSAAAAAQSDLLAALDDVFARTPHTDISGDLGGQTFHVGIHHISAALALTGTVTLDGQGDPDAVFIFVTDAAFTTAASSAVTLMNGTQASNVYWVAADAVGTGASSIVNGTILSHGAITLGAGTALDGRALSRDTVTLAGNTLTGVTPAVTP
jgi:hypothetical protein